MNLAMAVLLVLAVRRPALAVPALWVYLVYATLHLAIHVRYAGHLAGTSSALLLVSLGVLVVVPVALLILARRLDARCPG